MKPGSKYYHLVHGVRKLPQGEAFVATHNVEFTCQPESFRGVVYDLAAARGATWRGTVTIIGKIVVYAFYQSGDYMRPNLPAYPVVKKLRG